MEKAEPVKATEKPRKAVAEIRDIDKSKFNGLKLMQPVKLIVTGIIKHLNENTWDDKNKGKVRIEIEVDDVVLKDYEDDSVEDINKAKSLKELEETESSVSEE